MPRYRSGSQVKASVREDLVAILAEELKQEAQGGVRQPFIFEQEIPQTDTLHVVVFWDRWQEVPPEERSTIVVDAYERCAPASAAQVTIAMGVTIEEALRMDLLPFRVQPMERNGATGGRRMVDALMLDEGAVQTDRGLQLLFPTRRLAEEALGRLSKQAPDAHWAIVEKVASIPD